MNNTTVHHATFPVYFAALKHPRGTRYNVRDPQGLALGLNFTRAKVVALLQKRPDANVTAHFPDGTTMRL